MASKTIGDRTFDITHSAFLVYGFICKRNTLINLSIQYFFLNTPKIHPPHFQIIAYTGTKWIKKNFPNHLVFEWVSLSSLHAASYTSTENIIGLQGLNKLMHIINYRTCCRTEFIPYITLSRTCDKIPRHSLSLKDLWCRRVPFLLPSCTFYFLHNVSVRCIDIRYIYE